jgi:2-keto-4-pentenoate hydratase/2-oxohepta-3-ene-1,7-dioic acid hydratase in catechol pathway
MRIATLRRTTTGRTCLAVSVDNGAFVAVPDIMARLRPGTPDAQGLAEADFEPEGNRWMTPEGLAGLARLAAVAGSLAAPEADFSQWRLAPPVPNPGKIIAVGRNYMDHVREGQEIWAKRGRTVNIPQFPSAFAKYPSALAGPDDPIVIPTGVDDVDYEVELAVVIGKAATDIGEQHALDHVAGYTICNDVGARGIQRLEMEAQIGITLAKNFPTFAPMGPWLVTADEIPDPQVLEVATEVDGDRRQHASTADMIFPVRKLVAYWSRLGLFPGDIIITGTPSGVALAREEPARYYLRGGQAVTVSISGIGRLRNPLVAAGS